MKPNASTRHDEEKFRKRVSIMPQKLTEFEKNVYDFISARGELLTSDMPNRMSGAIPDLEKKGVVEVFKKRTSRWASRKRKFVRIGRSTSDS